MKEIQATGRQTLPEAQSSGLTNRLIFTMFVTCNKHEEPIARGKANLTLAEPNLINIININYCICLKFLSYPHSYLKILFESLLPQFVSIDA